MFTRTRHIYTLGTFSSLCLLFPFVTSAQEVAVPTPTPRLISGLLPTKGANPTASTDSLPAATVTPPAMAGPASSDAIPVIPTTTEPAQASVLETPTSDLPATIEPPVGGAASELSTDATATTAEAPLPAPGAAGFVGGNKPREFQGDELGQVLRLLARQAKIDLVVGESIQGTVTMRLENKSALQAIQIIVQDKGLYMYETDGTYFIKTEAEKKKEPTDAGYYTFSYGRASDAAPLLAGQILSGVAPQVDPRTNTIFYREFKSNMAAIAGFLQLVDKPTRQVMIEARLVEVNANPKQAYGVNWGGVLGSSSSPKSFKYGGTVPTADGTQTLTFDNGLASLNDFVQTGNKNAESGSNNPLAGLSSGFSNAFGNQLAILSIPQMSLTLRFLNEDADAEFLANPRIVTADNQEATIKIVRSQPVPQLNFNEQTATAVFGGFEEKEYGNKLVVRPAINKDDFISLSVKPEISNKVSDAQFTISGASVFSPIIDTRTLESNVLIKSGDTLAVGGLLQDETSKNRTKVPILGDIPGLGYLFQEKLNAKVKRNLLIFVTPTIIQQGYGTGLEDQVSGLQNSGEEFADPNGWRNNAKGSVRVIPTSNRTAAAGIPAPGFAKQPRSKRLKAGVPNN